MALMQLEDISYVFYIAMPTEYRLHSSGSGQMNMKIVHWQKMFLE
jgi:hypothetical protein